MVMSPFNAAATSLRESLARLRTRADAFRPFASVFFARAPVRFTLFSMRFVTFFEAERGEDRFFAAIPSPPDRRDTARAIPYLFAAVVLLSVADESSFLLNSQMPKRPGTKSEQGSVDWYVAGYEALSGCLAKGV
jgi:hypothetical protein